MPEPSPSSSQGFDGLGRKRAVIAFTGSPHDDSISGYPANDGIDSEIWVLTKDGSLVNVTDNDVFEGEPSWSPTGKHLSYGCVSEGEFLGTYDSDICVMNMRTGEKWRVTKHKGAEHTGTWSPDGTRIAFDWTRRRGGDVYTVGLKGGRWRRVTDDGQRYASLAWSPDGSRFAFSRRDGRIHVMSSDGSGVTQITRGRRVLDGSPAWSPDGEWLAFTRSSLESGHSQLYKVRTDGTGLTRLTDLLLDVKYPDWSPDGRRIAFSYGGNYRIVWVPSDGGPIRSLTKGLREDLHVSWAPVTAR